MNPPDQPTPDEDYSWPMFKPATPTPDLAPTPRTDKAAYRRSSTEVVPASFARTLETELARLRAENERLLDETVKLNGYADMHMKEKARAEKAEAALVAAVAEASRQVEASDSLYRKTCAEREEQRWLKECSMKRTGEVMAERDALAKDKARLDWLGEYGCDVWETGGIFEVAQNMADPTDKRVIGTGPNIRDAITAAMKGTPSNG